MGPFVAPTVLMGPFVAPTVMKGPFSTRAPVATLA
jgi:hypothetical protein